MPQTIYWHMEDLRTVPKNDNWLSEKEMEIQHTLRFAKRRSEWRLGRWVAKKALQKRLSLPLPQIEILPQESRAPHLLINNKKHHLVLSISHREQKAICAFSDAFDAIGCDLEFIEKRSDLFINDYLTLDEITHVRQNSEQKDLFSNLIWSAKESVSKVLQLGLNLDTKDVNVHTIGFSTKNEWNDLRISLKEDVLFFGYWKIIDNYVITLAAKESFAIPQLV